METMKGIFEKNINRELIYEAVIEKSQKKGRPKKVMKYALAAAFAAILAITPVLMGRGEDGGAEGDNIIINKADQMGAYKLDLDIREGEYAGETEFSILDGIQIPKDLTVRSKAELYSRDSKTGEYDRLAWYSYDCSSAKGDRRIGINFSYDEPPARCYIFEGGKTSLISGTEAMIYRHEDSYIAEFKKDGVYYSIETSAIEEEELIKLIESAVKQN